MNKQLQTHVADVFGFLYLNENKHLPELRILGWLLT